MTGAFVGAGCGRVICVVLVIVVRAGTVEVDTFATERWSSGGSREDTASRAEATSAERVVGDWNEFAPGDLATVGCCGRGWWEDWIG